MNVFVWVLLPSLAAAAAASWGPAAGSRRGDPLLVRTAFTVVLLALAWLLRADTVAYGRWLLIGVVLTVPSALRFSTDRRWRRAGVLALLLARAACALAVATLPPGDGPLVLPLVLVTGAVLGVVGAAFLAGTSPKRVDGIPLLGYALVVGLVPLAAWRSGHVLTACAATLVCAADLAAWSGRASGYSRALSQVLADAASVLLVVAALRV